MQISARMAIFFTLLSFPLLAMVPKGKIPPVDPNPTKPVWWGPDPTDGLDPSTLVGTLLMADLTRSALDDEHRAFLDRVRPGFLLLFEYNLVPGPGGPPLLRKLLDDVRAHAVARGYRPPVWAVDQEGGAISRLGSRHGFENYPPPRRVARWGDEGGARIIWGHMAETLLSTGLSVNLAPSLDLARFESSSLLRLRTFGDNPATVTRWGRIFFEAMAQGGIATVAKHLPGHGAATSDSHVELPRMDLAPREWTEEHLPPFEASVRWGVDGLMLAHLAVPHFDPTPGLPLSLSAAMARGFVRHRMKYDGLLYTDSLAMGAVTNDRSMALACEAALRAGVDVLMVPDSLEKVSAIHAYLVRRVGEDPQLFARAKESARRILLWRNLRERRPKPPAVISTDAFHQAMESMNGAILAPCARELESHRTRNAIFDLRLGPGAGRRPPVSDGGTILLRLPDLPNRAVTRSLVERLAKEGPCRALTAGDPVAWEGLGLQEITASYGLPIPD